MSDSTIKINAIVIRSAQSGENDRILTLLSPEIGRLSVIAKGVRSLKHQHRSSTVVLSYSAFVLKKLREGFYSLVSAELKEGFRGLSDDIELLSYGAYFSSLCEMCVQEGMGADSEVRLLLNSLHMLRSRKAAAPLIKCVFELKLCECCGILPEFSEECPCGEAASFFCVSDGEMRCTLHKTEDCVKLTSGMLKLADYITQNSLKDAFYTSFIPDDAFGLWRVTEPFLEYHLGKLPKSLPYLHDILRKMQ